MNWVGLKVYWSLAGLEKEKFTFLQKRFTFLQKSWSNFPPTWLDLPLFLICSFIYSFIEVDFHCKSQNFPKRSFLKFPNFLRSRTLEPKYISGPSHSLSIWHIMTYNDAPLEWRVLHCILSYTWRFDSLIIFLNYSSHCLFYYYLFIYLFIYSFIHLFIYLFIYFILFIFLYFRIILHSTLNSLSLFIYFTTENNTECFVKFRGKTTFNPRGNRLSSLLWL